MTHAKKAIIAAVLIAPLALAACSSDKDTSAAASSSSSAKSTTSAASTSVVATSSAAETATAATTEEPADSAMTAANAADAAAALNQIDPNQALTVAEKEPVEGGTPANAEQAAEIEGLVRTLAEPTTLRAYMTSFFDNVCDRVLDTYGGRSAIDMDALPDIDLAQAGAPQNTIESVSNIMVLDQDASAEVTANVNGSEETSVMRFLNEDGRWKMCD